MSLIRLSGKDNQLSNLGDTGVTKGGLATGLAPLDALLHSALRSSFWGR